MGFFAETVLNPTLPGFEDIFRYHDPRHARVFAKILPGEFYVTNSPEETIVTTLGSCVSVCIRDCRAGVGGMNHFMLPCCPKTEPKKATSALAVNAYGVSAVESLINAILKLGGNRKNFEIKVTGGGRIGAGPGGVGDQNAEFIREFLKTENLHPVAVDLGGRFSRRVRYNPLSGQLHVKKVAGATPQEVATQEGRYRESIEQPTVWGSLELF